MYSIAICLLERAGELPSNPSFQIFATDLSESALEKARAGPYLENIAQDVSPERLRRFFTKVDGRYQISKAIREMCVFARHDLTRDPPFSRMDLISCRNVLIYLEPRLQERVFATFHYALAPTGFLVLGPAESAGASSALFAPARREAQDLLEEGDGRAPAPPLRVARGRRREAADGERSSRPEAAARSEVPREADRMLLARYGPASVVVDEGLDILEFRGDTEPFLEHAHGQASLNLHQMARKGLLVELRQAIEEARRKDAPARKEGLRVRYRGQLRDVSLEVIPIKGRAAAERCLLVLFETEPERRARGAARRARRRRAAGAAARKKSRGSSRKLDADHRVPAHGRARARGRPRGAAVHERGGRSPATKSCRA